MTTSSLFAKHLCCTTGGEIPSESYLQFHLLYLGKLLTDLTGGSSELCSKPREQRQRLREKMEGSGDGGCKIKGAKVHKRQTNPQTLTNVETGSDPHAARPRARRWETVTEGGKQGAVDMQHLNPCLLVLPHSYGYTHHTNLKIIFFKK